MGISCVQQVTLPMLGTIIGGNKFKEFDLKVRYCHENSGK
jgi:hypothetical protein